MKFMLFVLPTVSRIPRLLVCSNVSPEAIGGIDRAAADFHELGERAAKRGMRVAFEALAWGRHINDYRDACAPTPGLFGFQHPETTPPSIPTTPRTPPE